MKKFLLSFIILLLLSAGAFAQQLGNEWIQYSQQYYKIPVAQTGYYRVSAQSLKQAGLVLETVNPRYLQLFHRGQEVAIRVEGEEDEVFNEADFIEFYGKANDGTLDKQLYQPVGAQPHGHINLFSDTTAYFLTWSNVPVAARRIATYTDLSQLTPIAYHRAEAQIVYRDQYSGGLNNSGTSMSSYEVGEGWTGVSTGVGANRVVTFDKVTNLVTGTPEPIQLELVLAGRNGLNHRVEIAVGPTTTSFVTIDTISFSAYNVFTRTFTIGTNRVSATGQLLVRIRPLGVNGNSDFVSVSAAKLTWPQQTSTEALSAKSFILPGTPLGRTMLEIRDAQPGYNLFDITDPLQVTRINGTLSGSIFRAAVQNNIQTRKLLFQSMQQVLVPASIQRVQFRAINPARFNYLIVSHSRLMQPVTGVANPVQAYANYRASTAGGSYQPLVVEINELYNQFAYGEASPLAIRNFAAFMLREGNPQYLFLIGKGGILTSRFAAAYNQVNLVPTYGVPASDHIYTTGLGAEPLKAAIPTGRLAATTPQMVVDYLNKVVEQEAAGYKDLWRKHIVQASGGYTQNEIVTFRNYINKYRNFAVNPIYAGKANNYYKATDQVIETVNLAPDVNRGVSIINVFGHSSPQGADVEIGYASNAGFGYNNKGKYPMVMLNGCNVGRIFETNNNNVNENWVLTPEKGAILFLAHSAEGYPYSLDRYTQEMYRVLFSDSLTFGSSIGQAHQHVIENYTKISGSLNRIDSAIFQQYILHGDPAIKLFAPEHADYKTSSNELSLKPHGHQPLTASSDSLQLTVIVSNFGRATEDSLQIGVKRRLPDNTQVVYPPAKFASVWMKDTLTLTIPNQGLNAAGTNIFEIQLDPSNLLTELDKNNNTGTLEVFIPRAGVVALFPKEFSIVNKLPVTLQAQSSNLLEAERGYLFEIDTTLHFNSINKQSHTIESGGLPSWTTTLHAMPDSTVYYWRVRFAEQKEPQDMLWSQSSFIYLPQSSEGWSQRHIQQHRKNEQVHVKADENKQQWEYESVRLTLEATTKGSKVGGGNSDIQIVMNGRALINIGALTSCPSNNLYAIAFDKNTLKPYILDFPNEYYRNYSCGVEPRIVNNFSDGEIRSATAPRLIRFIDFVKEGDYVFLMSAGNLNYQQWADSTRKKMEQLGANPQNIQTLRSGHPYMLFGQKGSTPGSAVEVLADPNLFLDGRLIPLDSQRVNRVHTFVGRYDAGSITSALIGPATKWNQLHAAWNSLESPTSADEWIIQILGRGMDGVESALYEGKPADALALEFIDAKRYPYLRLKATVTDTLNLTPPQLRFWQVNYEGVPEGVMHPQLAGSHHYRVADKQEGENFKIPFVFKNISQKAFPEKVVVRYILSHEDRRENIVKWDTLKAITSQDTAFIQIPIVTQGRKGRNKLEVYFNPRLQVEEYFENNQLEVSFLVKSDNVNPTLDVAFDGVKIMDGDIVSPRPLINISLRDENRFMPNQDTTGMEVYIKKPCASCPFERVSLSSPEVKFNPASATNPELSIQYQPYLAENGRYSLKVQGRDAAGNAAGSQDYVISFEVINESSVTNFYPYPNPFTTSTRFAFTLTGATVPQDLKIQIMTVTGKVVREIFKNELGPMRIGNNLTEFAWDGTDQWGDKLANGVYLYRVIIKDDNTFEHRSTAADDTFKKQYGKLYILR